MPTLVEQATKLSTDLATLVPEDHDAVWVTYSKKANVQSMAVMFKVGDGWTAGAEVETALRRDTTSVSVVAGRSWKRK
jgi:hypothetical protein